jgi:multisubunit Na+/H+ antiporter MnhC subunit
LDDLQGVHAMTESPALPVQPLRQGYVSAHSRGRWAIALLIAGIAINVLSLLITPLQYYFPVVESEELNSANAVGMVAALLQLGFALLGIVVYIATIVIFLTWLYRSYENLPALGVPRNRIEYSSGWAIGSFFVPFVNLAVPYLAVRELWRKSMADSSTMFGELSPPAFFPLWWATWLLSNFAGNIYFRFVLTETPDPNLLLIGGIVTSVLNIVSAMFLIKVIKEINRQQMESSQSGPREFLSSGPPPPVQFSTLGIQS